MKEPMLQVRDLRVSLGAGTRQVDLVRGVDLTINAGETVAVVGESGSGKSLTMLSVMGLLSPPLRRSSGEIILDGKVLSAQRESQMRQVRGRDMAMVYQDPMTSLNPYLRIGDQISEAMTVHGVGRAQAAQRTLELLSQVGIPDPERTARSYPHEFSGGMRQRAVIAMALAMKPRMLIADEPTTALDVTIQQQILALVDNLRRELGMTTIWVTHDLGVVARLVDRVIVMYAGSIVEDAPVKQLFRRPQHPYTANLLASLPNPADSLRLPLAQIPGRPPLPQALPAGCAYLPRCAQAQDICLTRPKLQPRADGLAACWIPPNQWVATQEKAVV